MIIIEIKDKTVDKIYKSFGFPPGITVDELQKYRKKKVSENLKPCDNLHLENGSFTPLKTEYKRRFINYFERFGDLYKQIVADINNPNSILDVNQDFQLRHRNEYMSNSLKPSGTLNEVFYHDNKANNENFFLTETRLNYQQCPNSEKPHLIKRPTNLKLEGNFYATTEQGEKFILHLVSQDAILQRRTTNLKLEGDMNINTENKEKFIPYAVQHPPPLYKKPTNLHLEGDMMLLTESREQFVQYNVPKRKTLEKKHTNLGLEGDLHFVPEYQQRFVQHAIERPSLIMPKNNLKIDGFSNDFSPVRHHHYFQPIPHLRSSPDLQKMQASPNKVKVTDINKEIVYRKIDSDGREYVATTTPRHEKKEVNIVSNVNIKAPSEWAIDHFECQPEYRKAYINYLTRQKLERNKLNDRIFEFEQPEKTAMESKLSQLETTAFGQKVTHPNTPTSAKSGHLSKSNKVFCKSIKVRNLASHSAYSTPNNNRQTLAKNKWIRDRDSSDELSQAFVILDRSI